MKPKICLIGASFSTNNMGVNALTSGTLKAFFARYPGGEFILLDYGKEAMTYNFQIGDSPATVQLVNIRFSKKFYLKNNIALLIMLAMLIRCIPFRNIRKKAIARNYWLGRIAEADVVTSIAGGDSFSDMYGLGRFFYVVLPQLLALILESKLVLLPQTIGPFKSRIARMVATFLLNRSDIVYSRDFEGVKEARNMSGSGIDSYGKVRFCYDVGFILDPVRPTSMDLHLGDQGKKENPLVGLNISGLLCMGGYSRNNMFGLRIDYTEVIKDIIDLMIGKKKAKVMLVPHVFGSHGESDSVACEKVYASLKDHHREHLLIARGAYNQNEIKYIIGKCDFFIGSRMHACIAALSQHIPTVSIAYSRKFTGVMQTIGIAELVADPRKLEKKEILRLIDNSFEKRTSIRSDLERTMPGVQATVLHLFTEIGSLLTEK